MKARAAALTGRPLGHSAGRPSPATAVVILCHWQAESRSRRTRRCHWKRHADTAIICARDSQEAAPPRAGSASGPGAEPAFASTGARRASRRPAAGHCQRGSSPGRAPCQSQTGQGGGARRLRLTSAAPPVGGGPPGRARELTCHRQGDRRPAGALQRGPPSARPRASARAVAECRARLPLGGFQRPASRGIVAAAASVGGSLSHRGSLWRTWLCKLNEAACHYADDRFWPGFRKAMLASDAPVVIPNRIPRSRPRNPIQLSRAPLRPQARPPPLPSLPPAGLERAVCSLHFRGDSYQRISHQHPCPLLLRARLATPLPPPKHPRWPRPNLPAVVHVRRDGARRIPWAGPAAGRLGSAPASARAARRALEAALQCAIRMLACGGLIGCSE